MATWSRRRQIFIVILLLCFFGAIGAGVYYVKYYDPPSCTDKKQNQEEEGIDCGGPCAVVCESRVAKPIVMWSRTFKVAPGLYNAVAYIENTNPDLGVTEAIYRFNLYDASNLFVSERVGRVYIGPSERFAVFEARIPTGARTPTKAFFEFLQFSPWTKVAPVTAMMSITDTSVSNASSRPRADATIHNDTIGDIANIDVVAIVYDQNDNAIGASATYLENLRAESAFPLAFTWGAPFVGQPTRVEVIPRIDPFKFILKKKTR